jgi:hypothetical protein
MADQNDQNQYLQPPGARRPSTASSDVEFVFGSTSTTLTPAPSRAASTNTSQVGDNIVQITSKTLVLTAHDSSFNVPSDAGANRGVIRYSPHSKTVIGRVTYPLTELPKLFVAEVKTMVEPKGARNHLQHTAGATWEDFQGERLRKFALSEFVKHPRFDRVRNGLAIYFGARQNMDHIIASTNEIDEQHLTTSLPVQTVQLASTKRLAKRDDQTDYNRPFACAVQQTATQLGQDDLTKMYRSSLTALIRNRVHPTGQWAYDVAAGVIEGYPLTGSHSNKIDPFNGTERPCPLEIGSGLPLGLRVQPSVDFGREALNFDLDLVPSGRQDQANGQRAALSIKDTMHRGLPIAIREFKMPGDVDPFDVGGVSHSIEAYYKDCKPSCYTTIDRLTDQNDRYPSRGPSAARPETSPGVRQWHPLVSTSDVVC